jgi:hypothetical protein
MDTQAFRWETETAANIKFEIPSEWMRVARENVSVFHSARPGVAIEFVSMTEGPAAEEKLLLGELDKMLTNPTITHPTTAVRQHGLSGHAFGGSAKKNGLAVEWFSLWLGDGAGKGVCIVGYAAADLIATQKQALMRILDSVQPAITAVAATPPPPA